ncbi:MAG TPA: ribosome biogenesis GTP-binding protein YihA/YsxC [Nitrospiria bacterium]|jgi:GTP-binding protein|nr:ribosome biogenesis GTP-binding protein YihA/YsxC [Nitrospiria bacterium]
MKIHGAEFVKSCASLRDCPTDGLPEIALAGRSNVGKSSLLNSLVRHKGLAKTSGTPGKTRLINFFKITVSIKSPAAFYLVDLPGYGYANVSLAQRQAWGDLVNDYLKHRPALRGLIVLLDIRLPPSLLDQQLITWIHSCRLRYILVATKSDQMPRGRLASALGQVKTSLPGIPAHQVILPFSSKTGQGRDSLLEEIAQFLKD